MSSPSEFESAADSVGGEPQGSGDSRKEVPPSSGRDDASGAYRAGVNPSAEDQSAADHSGGDHSAGNHSGGDYSAVDQRPAESHAFEADPDVDPDPDIAPDPDRDLREPRSGADLRPAGDAHTAFGVDSQLAALGPTRHAPTSTPLGEALRRPLPMFLCLLIGFLICDATLRLVKGVQLFSLGTISEQDKRQLFEHLVVSTFYLLLFLQVLLRTLAARIWGTIVFLFHSVWLIVRYAFHDPEAWLSLSDSGRLQVFVRLFFFTVVVVMLNRSPSKETLTT